MALVFILLHKRIRETCVKNINFRVKIEKLGSSPFLIKVCSPLDPVNPLYCILVWSVYTIYISKKLGQGWTYFKIENGDYMLILIFDRT